jgi:hypothetical protein
MKSSKLPDLSPPFYAINLVGRARASEGHEVLQLPDLSPRFCAINLVRRARASKGHKILQATRPQPTFLRHQLGRAGSGIGRARSPPGYPTSAHLSTPSTPTNSRSRKVGPSIPPMKKRGGLPKAPRRITRSLCLSLKKSHPRRRTDRITSNSTTTTLTTMTTSPTPLQHRTATDADHPSLPSTPHRPPDDEFCRRRELGRGLNLSLLLLYLLLHPSFATLGSPEFSTKHQKM